MLRLRLITLASFAVFAALLASAVPAAAATASTAPRIARPGAAAGPAAGGGTAYLNSDSCTSSTFCMAVGAISRNGLSPGLSDVFNGTKWVAKPVPSPRHRVNIFANEVACGSATSCLFVGDHYGGPRSRGANLAEAWNGSSWRIVTGKNPPFTDFSGLDDVACPTATFCLVVGFAGTGRRFQDTAYTWKNGRTWHRITVPRPRGARNSQLGGLACADAADCMAVGDYTSASGRYLPFAVRWHAGSWKVLATPAVPRQRSATFQAVGCPAPTLCVAVGDTVDSTRGRFYHAFAEVWSGGTWRLSTLRRPPSLFFGVSCPAADRCLASGSTFPSKTGFAHPLIETWNGRTWTTASPARTSAPDSGDVLAHVSCVSTSTCEAVGHRYNPSFPDSSNKTLAELWNGHQWTVQTTPDS
jgi:hypothetical protein